MERRFPVFLAHITAKRLKAKSEEKRTLRTYQLINDLSEYFLRNLPVVLRPQWSFKLIWVPGAAPEGRVVAKITNVILWIPSAPILAKYLKEAREFHRIHAQRASKKVLGRCVVQREKVIFLCITPSEEFMRRTNNNSRFWELGAVCSRLKILEALSVRNQVYSVHDCDIRITTGESKVVADALSRKEREPPTPLRNYRALVITISLVSQTDLKAQTEANTKTKKH
ncbi:hypothetical protein Tco_0211333 [Tanacetum coccineum]